MACRNKQCCRMEHFVFPWLFQNEILEQTYELACSSLDVSDENCDPQMKIFKNPCFIPFPYLLKF